MENKNLVIVESPTKAKTIGKILGEDFTVLSCMGHLIDLPKQDLGVDVDKDFEPEFVVIPGRKKTLAALKKEAKDKDKIYIATDPDREGEAIGWQIKERILKDKNVLRLTFHEITSQAVTQAFNQSRSFDMNMIEAQLSRRILDRLVGYFLSPLLWKKIVRGLSAGRVQSVALRLIIEREKEIRKFVPKEYWEIEARFSKPQEENIFTAKLNKIAGKEVRIPDETEAGRLSQDIKSRKFEVFDIRKGRKKRYPEAPFITSTLQQEAFNKLRFNATKTMIIAQQLYEGIEIGVAGPVGLITYMRTDSPRVAQEALKEVRELIAKEFGKDYLPETAYEYKVKKHSQEAHEAIRPATLGRHPESLKSFLTPEQYKLYELIYNRFIASQMSAAEYATTALDIRSGEYSFLASGSSLVFAGFTAVYSKDNGTEDKPKEQIPELEKGQQLQLHEVTPSQHFTKPPSRFSDSSLVKALEEDGIGRPSTYAPIISTLLLRDYVRRLKGYLHPTELGFKVAELLVEYFPEIMDLKFTALMEEELDEVEEGKLERVKVLRDFYQPFKKDLDFAQANIKKEVITTSEICEKCGKPMIVKWGRKGKFLSCSGFPACKFSKSIGTGVRCPEPDCGGELIERKGKRGFFYGCSNFPKCRYTSRTLPANNEQ